MDDSILESSGSPVGRQIVSSKVWERKRKYFCRELVVYSEERKYRTSGKAYEVMGFKQAEPIITINGEEVV